MSVRRRARKAVQERRQAREKLVAGLQKMKEELLEIRDAATHLTTCKLGTACADYNHAKLEEIWHNKVKEIPR